MSFVELIAAISRQTGVPKRTVRIAIQGLIEETKKTVMAGERVVLPGFGVFVSHAPKARPLFGGKCSVVEKPRIRFKQSRRSK